MKNYLKLVAVCFAVFLPLSVMASGRCGSISSCDSRYDVRFISCYRDGANVIFSYEITNNGPAVRAIKIWQHPNFTNFIAGGSVYNKDHGLVNTQFGSASGIGDLFVPLGARQSMTVTHVIKVPASTNKFDRVNVRINNYGTGDWNCARKDIHFNNVEWD